jgi:lambda repressor-like predicted transcriptional regulator
VQLFAPRPLPVRLPAVTSKSPPRRRSPDPVLASLAESGRSLREIARQVGMSHEAVRRRLRPIARDHVMAAAGMPLHTIISMIARWRTGGDGPPTRTVPGRRRRPAGG